MLSDRIIHEGGIYIPLGIVVDNADANNKKDDHEEANGPKQLAKRLQDSSSSVLLSWRVLTLFDAGVKSLNLGHYEGALNIFWRTHNNKQQQPQCNAMYLVKAHRRLGPMRTSSGYFGRGENVVTYLYSFNICIALIFV